MFDNTNPYTLRKKIVGGITRYYVSFTDGQGKHRETEVSRPVFLEFKRFVKTERNLRRWDERHGDSADIDDDKTLSRMNNPPQSLEESVFDSLRSERLREAIQSLPEIQRRRFVLYHEFGLTYEQIATMEGRTSVAVKYTIDKAEEAIRKKLEEFSD